MENDTDTRYSLDATVQMVDTYKMNQDASSSKRALLKRSTVWYCLASTAAYLSLAHLASNDQMTWIDAAPTTGFFWIAIGPRVLSTTLSLTGRGTRLTHQISMPWKETWREALLCGASIALAMWFKTQAITKIELSQFQTLEVFIAPMLLQLLKPLRIWDTAPASNLNLCAHLICLVMSFSLLAQTSLVPGIVLGLLSCFFQATFLGLLKRWLVRAPQFTAYSVVHYMGPFALIVSGLAACTSWIRSPRIAYDHLSQAMPVALRHNPLTWTWFVLFQAIEAFTVVAAIKETNSPVSIALLAPLRNLISLVGLGLMEGRMAMKDIVQSGSVYFATCLLLWFVDVDEDPSWSCQTRSKSEDGDFEVLFQSPEMGSTSSSSSTRSTLVETKATTTSTRGIQFGYVAIFLIWVIQQPMTTQSITTMVLPDVATTSEHVPETLDVVFSYYKEPIDVFKSTIDWVQTMPSLSSTKRRIIIYVKDRDANLTHLMQVTGADEVMRLNNTGREGSTYLTHILRHYNSTTSFEDLTLRLDLGQERIVSTNRTDLGLADHTLFMQPHIDRQWLATPRLDMFNSTRTGFLSLSLYLKSDCGKDGLGNGHFDRMRDIFEIFQETICPPTLQLATYAGQFVVSKVRLLRNTYSKYSNLWDLINANDSHWLHREAGTFHWDGVGPPAHLLEHEHEHVSSAPYFGHSLERSWPIIFDCNQPKIVNECQSSTMKIGENPWACQCTDP